MDNETEDPPGDDQPDDQPVPASTTPSDDGGAEGDDADDVDADAGGDDADDVDAEGDDADDVDAEADQTQVLAQVSQDVATIKMLVAILLAVVLIASVVLGVLIRTSDETSETDAAASTTVAPPTTEPALESVAGQPCVAMVDPLPEGAPPLEVEVGPAPTSLVIDDIKEGTGAEVTETSTVTVNYVGVACSTGKIFDTSYTGGTSTPATFPVAQVVPGFGKGVTGMKVGGQRLIGIPSEEAYGAAGGGSTIAPDEALWFVVELTDVTP